MTAVTVDQLKTLWTQGGRIDRGPEHSPVTQEALGALASGLDTDDDGMPADEGQWEVLADQLNGETPGDLDGSDAQEHAYTALLGTPAFDETSGGRARRGRDARIRSAIKAGVPVSRIATAVGLSIPRIYQIRDGRR